MTGAMAYLPIKGSQVYYETSGVGEPVLLLHGGFGTVEDFASQTPELAKHFKVIAFDRPGHGRSADNGESFSYATMAEDTVDFMESLGLKGTDLMGWSDGAVVALLVAISRPDLVKRLVSVSGCFSTPEHYLSAAGLDWMRSATPESFRRDAPRVVSLYEEVAPDGPAHFPTFFEKTMKMWLNEPDIRKEELAKIGAPTLVIAGDRDAITLEHTLELFRSIKGAQLCIVPRATHLLLSDRPEATNRPILEFLLAKEKSK
jgi:pimeloyl-ACP methyl ester carboxylesterase